MNWADIIGSVESRITDARARDHELGAMYRDLAGRSDAVVELYCHGCGYVSLLASGDALICLRCGAEYIDEDKKKGGPKPADS